MLMCMESRLCCGLGGCNVIATEHSMQVWYTEAARCMSGDGSVYRPLAQVGDVSENIPTIAGYFLKYICTLRTKLRATLLP